MIPGSEADGCAQEFVSSLRTALHDLDRAEREREACGFSHALRKADHVTELRQTIAILIDLLTDWEMLCWPGGTTPRFHPNKA